MNVDLRVIGKANRERDEGSDRDDGAQGEEPGAPSVEALEQQARAHGAHVATGPTIPATEPSALWLTKGTTAKVAPSAICTNRLKTTSVPMARTRVSICENTINITPSTRTAQKSQPTRPRSPRTRPARSLNRPPSVRAKRFISPNSEATTPAAVRPSSKRSAKYSAATLLMVSSIPKQAP